MEFLVLFTVLVVLLPSIYKLNDKVNKILEKKFGYEEA